MMATTLCRNLEWDGRFFGRRIARVDSDELNRDDAAKVMHWSSEEGIDGLYFLCRPDDDESVAVAEENGFHLVDVRIELSWRVQEVQTISPVTARKFQKTDLAELQQLA